MVGWFLIVGSFWAALGVWLGAIRPYLSRHGATVITGASWGLSAWADWQQCSEITRENKEPRALTLSRLFAATQIGFVSGIILAIFGI